MLDGYPRYVLIRVVSEMRWGGEPSAGISIASRVASSLRGAGLQPRFRIICRIGILLTMALLLGKIGMERC